MKALPRILQIPWHQFSRKPLLDYCRPVARPFHTSSPLAVIKPFLLSDIGEGKSDCSFVAIAANGFDVGIKEVQIIQWFVEPEARVEQFDKLCEVQSDKAAVDVGRGS